MVVILFSIVLWNRKPWFESRSRGLNNPQVRGLFAFTTQYKAVISERKNMSLWTIFSQNSVFNLLRDFFQNSDNPRMRGHAWAWNNP
jgi:hypothetical protein